MLLLAGDMKKIFRILRALKAFCPLYNNRVFRFFLGIAIFCLFGFTAQRWTDNISSMWEGMLFEILFFISFYAVIYFTVFSLIDIFSDRAASFHETHNKSNIDKQPIKWFLKRKVKLSTCIKMLFNFWYICVLIVELRKII
ncbi:hypothetical protein [Enterobacter sp.]|uniref:hypothetical protein n=1 Tax=Enterobacter sp. TaxID=42895 RepID=UPI00296FAFF3|nr:hypothetical protein [Enterobacter sp.]